MSHHITKNQTQFKNLGVIIDFKATCLTHIQHTKNSCYPQINIIKTPPGESKPKPYLKFIKPSFYANSITGPIFINSQTIPFQIIGSSLQAILTTETYSRNTLIIPSTYTHIYRCLRLGKCYGYHLQRHSNPMKTTQQMLNLYSRSTGHP